MTFWCVWHVFVARTGLRVPHLPSAVVHVHTQSLGGAAAPSGVGVHGWPRGVEPRQPAGPMTLDSALSSWAVHHTL